MFFLAEQITVGGIRVRADQHGPAALKDLVVRADADWGKVLPFIDGLGLRHGPLKDVVDRADRDRVVEEVAEQFRNAALGTVAIESQAEDQLLDPRLGHRQRKEDAVVLGLVGRKGFVQGFVRFGGLPVKELPADLVLSGQLANRPVARQNLSGQLLPSSRIQPFRRVKGFRFRLQRNEIGVRIGNHVCFLLENWRFRRLPVWGKQAF